MTPEVPWLAEPWGRVARALQRDQMPAGLLILGRAGSGRETFAETIARALLCLEPLPDGSACGHCAACREMDGGAHPDFLSVHIPEDKTRILVEQIRELNRGLSLTAGEKGRRCAIVSPAESLSAAAQNALLKTLEEPPAGVTLILISQSASRLLPTIASRCLRLPVTVPAEEDALAWLERREERRDWPLLLALSAGAPLAAERLAGEAGAAVAEGLQGLLGAAMHRRDPLAVAADFKAWPLERFAVLVAWVAGSALRAAVSAGMSWWPRDMDRLAGRADRRRLFELWREANRVAADAVALNPALARDHLVLLLISAFDHDARGK